MLGGVDARWGFWSSVCRGLFLDDIEEDAGVEGDGDRVAAVAADEGDESFIAEKELADLEVDADGPSAIHVTISNTLNTPIEALELAYPLHVEEYAIRLGSGGDGTHAGGDGVVRSLRVLEQCRLSVLAQRRALAPRGAAGGQDGARGRTLVNGVDLPATAARDLAAGDVVRIETPGGGGYGRS